MLTDQLSTEALGVLLHAAGAVSGVVDTPPCRFEVNGHLIDVYIDGAHLPAGERSDRPNTADRDRRSDLQPALRRSLA